MILEYPTFAFQDIYSYHCFHYTIYSIFGAFGFYPTLAKRMSFKESP